VVVGKGVCCHHDLMWVCICDSMAKSNLGRREVQESECFVVSIVVEWGGAVVVVIVRSEGEGSRRPTRYAHEL
jgi:hypothetical protein